MSDRSRQDPYFSDRSQAILKYSHAGNLFNISSLNEFCRPVDTSGFAIKFVTDGTECYTVNGQPYRVQAGSYLLVNGEKNARVEIDSQRNVKGICINIANTVVADVVASLRRPDTAFADPDLAVFFYTDHFLEHQYQAADTLLGGRLQQIGASVQQQLFTTADINLELFFSIAEQLVRDQVVVFRQLQSVRAVRQATKRDLLRRVLRGKEYMDAYYTQPLNIETVAREAAMSEFHFFRLFRAVFGTSPHQYLLGKRLQAAATLLSAGLPVLQAALDCGFADIYSFSKAFKKRFGVPPSAFSAKNSRIL